MKELKKTAVVTGASGGIGQSIASRFLQEGYNVVYADLDPVKTDSNQTLFVKTDVTKSADITHLIEQSINHFGSLDVFINCAGIGIRSPFLEVTEEIWDKTMAVNLKGTFLCTQQAAKAMVNLQTAGAIINISSICGTVADRFSYHAHYEASKGGVNLLTKAAALEMAPHGIRINAVAPGRIQTPLLNSNPDHVNRVSSFIPLGHYGEPADVAGTVNFLASADAKYITGAIIYVDGGWTIQ